MSTAPDTNPVVLDLYKTAVEFADRLTSRRAAANSFFLTLNTALAAIVGIVSAARRAPRHASVPAFDGFGLVTTAIAGIVLALVWWALLRYYRRLSKAKWDVINAMEKQLPVQPFTDEWKRLHADEQSIGVSAKQRWWTRLKLKAEHREATVIEQVVPFVFVAIYAALGIRAIA